MPSRQPRTSTTAAHSSDGTSPTTVAPDLSSSKPMTPSSGLTVKEHATRAMLLGLVYCRPVHAYMKLTNLGGYWLCKTAIHADTLEQFEHGVMTACFRDMGRQTTRFHVGDTNYED